MSGTAKKEYLIAIKARYQKASRTEKQDMLNEFWVAYRKLLLNLIFDI